MDDSPREEEEPLWRAISRPLSLSCSIIFWFSLGHPSLAASFETLQCEGPVSPGESRRHTDEDVTNPNEAGYQIKGYTFSEPFHLIVSYGKVLGRPDQCSKPILAP
jgi:hypothetical protein